MHPHIAEKDRDHRSRYHTANYNFSPDSTHVLFDSGGELWNYDLRTSTGVDLGNTGAGSGDDPKFAPTQPMISYVKDHNLFVRAIAGGNEVNLTNTHDPAILNGEVDWVYEEELDVRSNYYWSPDSKNLAYLQANETHVPLYPLVDWDPVHATIDQQRYPQPGDPNPDVRIGVVSNAGGTTHWIKLPISPGNDYIPRFGWVNDHTLWIETLLRDHKHLNLYFADAHTGTAKLVLAQTDDKFFDESYDLRFLKKSPEFLLTSWTDGHTHIYRYKYTATEATLENEVEKGAYEVEQIAGLNEAAKTIFYQSNEGDPRDNTVWSVKYDGSGKHQVSGAHGFHHATVSPTGVFFADEASDTIVPTTMNLCNAGGTCNPYWRPAAMEGHTVRAPEELVLNAADGTALYATLLMPEGATNPASVPLINNPYGGPHVQTVEHRFNPGLFLDQLYTEHGFAVLHVDNRGMGSRGRDFAVAAYHNFLPIQFADQLSAIDQVLATHPQLDPKRLGWTGWSWGGSFTLYAMTHSDRFRAGVEGGPVTDWRNYDSIYTERYLGLPSENADLYKTFSVVNNAADLHGHLLMVHGTGDDNVHVANTIQFIQQLVDHDKSYDLQLYPNVTHSLGGYAEHLHFYERGLQQWETYLK
jgi:dipeptidyl-peptidase-4